MLIELSLNLNVAFKLEKKNYKILKCYLEDECIYEIAVNCLWVNERSKKIILCNNPEINQIGLGFDGELIMF